MRLAKIDPCDERSEWRHPIVVPEQGGVLRVPQAANPRRTQREKICGKIRGKGMEGEGGQMPGLGPDEDDGDPDATSPFREAPG